MTIEQKTGVADPAAKPAEGQKTVLKNPEATEKKVVSEKPNFAGMSLLEVYKMKRGLNDPKKPEVGETGTEEAEEAAEGTEEVSQAEGTEAAETVKEEVEGAVGETEAGENEDDGLPKRAQKRIGKLTAEKADLERRLQEALAGKKPEAEPEAKAAPDKDLSSIEAEAKNLRGLIRQIDALVIRRPKVDENGDEYWEVADDKGVNHKLTRERVSQMRLEYDTRLNEELPQKYQSLSQERKLKEDSSKELEKFAWMKDEKSKGRERFEFYKNHPRYKNFRESYGEADALIALAVEGELALESRLSKREKPLERKKAAPKPPLPSAAPAPETEESGNEAELLQEARRLKERARISQNREDAIKFLAFKNKHKLT